MKKILAVFLAVLMARCICPVSVFAEDLGPSASEFIVENMIAANTWEEVFSRHDSLQIRTEQEDGSVSTCFLTKDYAYEAEYGNLYDTEDNWRYVDAAGEAAFAYDWYAMSEEERDELIWKPEFLFPALYENVLLQEQIVDLTENEDGTLTLSLSLGAEEFAAIQESFGNPLPEEYAGMEYLSVFTLDADTLEILASEENTILGKEKTRLIRTEFEYDAEQPEEAAEMLALAEEFRTAEPKDPRTVTVIYQAGDADEERYSVVTDRKFRVVPFLREGYGLFSDPEGTEVFAGSDDPGDAVLYAFPAGDALNG